MIAPPLWLTMLPPAPAGLGEETIVALEAVRRLHRVSHPAFAFEVRRSRSMFNWTLRSMDHALCSFHNLNDDRQRWPILLIGWLGSKVEALSSGSGMPCNFVRPMSLREIDEIAAGLPERVREFNSFENLVEYACGIQESEGWFLDETGIPSSIDQAFATEMS
ncbi:MAG: hypothetical protein HYY24_21310 [Verrucomicrobia bacterium]|nr:hypothetical protein [Verrucomicrobiota bacterium]